MSRQVLIVQEQETLYGLWADTVIEVLSDMHCTKLPKDLPYYEGITNYKGSIIPVFSLACISGRETDEEGTQTVLIVLETPQGTTGLMVSEVLNVIRDTGVRMPYEQAKLNHGVVEIAEIMQWKGDPVFLFAIDRMVKKINAPTGEHRK